MPADTLHQCLPCLLLLLWQLLVLWQVQLQVLQREMLVRPPHHHLQHQQHPPPHLRHHPIMTRHNMHEHTINMVLTRATHVTTAPIPAALVPWSLPWLLSCSLSCLQLSSLLSCLQPTYDACVMSCHIDIARDMLSRCIGYVCSIPWL